MGIEWDDIPHVAGAQEARAGHLLLRVGYSTGKKTHRAAWLVEVAHTDGERYLNLALSFEDTPEAAKLAAETFARDWVRRQAEALGDGDPLAELEAMGAMIACSNDAEDLMLTMGHDHKCISQDFSEHYGSGSITALRRAAARLLARVKPTPE